MRRARPVTAAALLAVGVLSLLLWSWTRGNEALPYTTGAAPPAAAHVTRDAQYSLAIPGGVHALLARGAPAGAGSSALTLTCSWTGSDTAPEPLTLTPENTDTKATNTIARFAAPTTGDIRVSCANWGAVYIPDADNRPTDWAGFWIAVSCLTLPLGAAVWMSVAYEAYRRRPASAAELDETADSVDAA
jgi:hypothetical protein